MNNLTREEIIRETLSFYKGCIRVYCLDSISLNLIDNAESFEDLVSAISIIGIRMKDSRLLSEEDYSYIRKAHNMHYKLPDSGVTPNQILLEFFEEESVQYITLLSSGDLAPIYLDGEFISADLNKVITRSMLNNGIASLLTIGSCTILID